MNVTITDIKQSYSLASGSVSSFLVFKLPSGLLVEAPIDDKIAAIVISEANAREQPPPVVGHRPIELSEEQIEEAYQPAATAVPPEVPAIHHVTEGIVRWEELPDTQLPPMMKHIMRASKLPPELTIEELDTLKMEMASQLANRPRAGQVNFNAGPQRTVQSKPRRTVPQDSMGNPLPPGGVIEPDPGEGADEDGVEQV